MTLVTAIVAKNESERYLARVLRRCREFSDHILLLDDGSSDDTVEVARLHGCEVRERSAPALWGSETPARKELWEWGAEVAGDGWLLICDADQLLVGDPRPYCESWMTNTWSFVLYDCWNEEQLHRADGYWQGYKYPRPWLFAPARVPPNWTADWSGRGIHAGHAPANFPIQQGFANDLYWLHLGWLKPEDRKMKYERYRSQWDQLTEYERGHVESIMEDA